MLHAQQVEDLPGDDGDLGGVDAVGAEHAAAAALGALVEVVEPLLDHIFGELAPAGQLAQDLARGLHFAAVDAADQLGPEHRHVLGIAAADEEVALVGAGPATHADVHEQLEAAETLQALGHALADDALPVGRQLPVVVSGRPVPGVGQAHGLQGRGLGGIEEVARFELGLGVHPALCRGMVIYLTDYFWTRSFGTHDYSSLFSSVS